MEDIEVTVICIAMEYDAKQQDTYEESQQSTNCEKGFHGSTPSNSREQS